MTSAATTLLDLPAEVRQQIFRYVLIPSLDEWLAQIRLCLHLTITEPPSPNTSINLITTPASLPALLQTSRPVKLDTRPIYYAYRPAHAYFSEYTALSNEWCEMARAHFARHDPVVYTLGCARVAMVFSGCPFHVYAGEFAKQQTGKADVLLGLLHRYAERLLRTAWRRWKGAMVPSADADGLIDRSLKGPASTTTTPTREKKLDPLRVYIAARVGISGAFLMEDVLLSFCVRREDEEDMKLGLTAWMFRNVDVEILASRDMGEC